MMAIRGLTDELRSTFSTIADYLIPAYRQMPVASAVDVSGALLDKVLAVRPDLSEALLRGLTTASTARMESKDAAQSLYRQDREAFDAISTAASGGYYMDDHIRDLIGYPGQEYIVPDDPYAPQSYVADGALKRVFDRGPIYVPTPGEVARKHAQLMKEQ